MHSLKPVFFAAVFFAAAAALAQTPPTEAAKLTLPATGNVFASDIEAGKASLVQLHASEVIANHHTGSNFARGLVYSGPRATMDLAGAAAAISLHTPHPAFYVRLNADDAELMAARLTLVHVKPAKDHRVIVTMHANLVGGHAKRDDAEVPVTKAGAEGTAWLKVTPQEPLANGEYAILFLPKDPAMIPDTVYDFNVAN